MSHARLRSAALVTLLSGLMLAAQGADVERGRALYDGRVPMAMADGAARTPRACVDCHRPSGMGNFEGGLAVPPITGPTLFRPWDRDTAHFFSASSTFRVRPAYDDAALARLLREGTTPDGLVLHPAMPRYSIGDAELVDLAAYLRQLSSGPPVGIDADTVQLATVSTPDADPVRRDAMLATLQRFVAQKNGQSRHEGERSAQSVRTREMVMYRKFRIWKLDHWALQGAPETWATQLERWQAQRPAYALVAGIGRAEWALVDAFCERRRIPCLLPLIDAGRANGAGFYSVHYHAGIEADATLAADALKAHGIATFVLRGDPADAILVERVRAALIRAGLHEGDDASAAIVSTLAPPAHIAWLQSSRPDVAVVWLAGTHAIGRLDIDAALALTVRGVVVSPMQIGDTLDRQLVRARTWLRSQGLAALPVDVAASTLQAATVLGEGLAHADFAFTQAYVLELLEHGLENVVPWSPYPRLAIGPGQRVASKGSWVGSIEQGRIDWQWQIAR